MGEYFLPTEIELSDIQRVESMIEARLEHMEVNYPYAKTEIGELETALRVLNDLIYDLD